MKIIVVNIAFFMFVANIQAQTKTLIQLKTDSIGNKVIEYLANHQTDSIYRMCSGHFKSQISQDNFESISQNKLYAINDFKRVGFIKTIKGINKYKVSGQPDLQLFIGLDADFKIETLLVQPFAED
ncbi:MAG: hypothetical protein ABI261_00310 [Ginsengibacter sp.]